MMLFDFSDSGFSLLLPLISGVMRLACSRMGDSAPAATPVHAADGDDGEESFFCIECEGEMVEVWVGSIDPASDIVILAGNVLPEAAYPDVRILEVLNQLNAEAVRAFVFMRQESGLLLSKVRVTTAGASANQKVLAEMIGEAVQMYVRAVKAIKPLLKGRELVTSDDLKRA